VGGAEEKIGDITILRRFASLCGTDGRIAIIPTASEVSDTGARYETIFQGLGVTEARSLPIHTRADAEIPEHLQMLDRATGIFLTGGNQLRLSTMIGGTSMAKVLRRSRRQRSDEKARQPHERQPAGAGCNVSAARRYQVWELSASTNPIH